MSLKPFSAGWLSIPVWVTLLGYLLSPANALLLLVLCDCTLLLGLLAGGKGLSIHVNRLASLASTSLSLSLPLFLFLRARVSLVASPCPSLLAFFRLAGWTRQKVRWTVQYFCDQLMLLHYIPSAWGLAGYLMALVNPATSQQFRYPTGFRLEPGRHLRHVTIAGV